MKNKKIFLCIIIIFVLFSMTASTIYLITKMTSPNRDDWYQDGINAFVIDYIKKAESIESEIQVYKYEFVNFDTQIAEQNRTTTDKQYPFEKVRVTAETRNQEFTLFLTVTSEGDLIVTEYNKKDHYNPFLR